MTHYAKGRKKRPHAKRAKRQYIYHTRSKIPEGPKERTEYRVRRKLQPEDII